MISPILELFSYFCCQGSFDTYVLIVFSKGAPILGKPNGTTGFIYDEMSEPPAPNMMARGS